MAEFITTAIAEQKSMEQITDDIVSKAIESGSPDNVTVLMIDLAELYQRWQRSTPFQGGRKDNYMFQCESQITQREDCDKPCARNIKGFNTKQVRSEKSHLTADDMEIDVEAQA